MRSIPFPPWPYFDDEQVDIAADVLRSGRVNYWTGNIGKAFEARWAEFCGARYCLALSNGTVALELALRAVGVGPGDDVIVTPRSFVASAACVIGVGARPVFADVDPDSGNLTAESIEAALTPATTAMIPVHLAGWPCDMPAIMDLAGRHDLDVIEDCAQAQGATVGDRIVGSFGRAAAFSFCQDKIMTTGGEGGAVLTSDSEVRDSIWAARDHGKSYAAYDGNEDTPGFRWVHESVGTNARLTEFQSALGLEQIDRLPEWLKLRRDNAMILLDACKGIPGLRVATPAEGIGHAYYKCYVFTDPEALRPDWDKRRIIGALTAEGIPVSTGSYPEIYREKAFAAMGTASERLPVAKRLGETSLMFKVHPTLGPAEMNDTVEAIGKVMRVASA